MEIGLREGNHLFKKIHGLIIRIRCAGNGDDDDGAVGFSFKGGFEQGFHFGLIPVNQDFAIYGIPEIYG